LPKFKRPLPGIHQVVFFVEERQPLVALLVEGQVLVLNENVPAAQVFGRAEKLVHVVGPVL
jgi:hypothetical protein